MEPTSYRFHFQAYIHLHMLQEKKENPWICPLTSLDPNWQLLDTGHLKVHKNILEPEAYKLL